jgi:hypothetical protein
MPDMQDESFQRMRDLISTGIVYEDEFIDRYLKILRDEGFMYVFGENKHEAEILLSTLIEESRDHKNDLERMYQTLR